MHLTEQATRTAHSSASTSISTTPALRGKLTFDEWKQFQAYQAYLRDEDSKISVDAKSFPTGPMPAHCETESSATNNPIIETPINRPTYRQQLGDFTSGVGSTACHLSFSDSSPVGIVEEGKVASNDSDTNGITYMVDKDKGLTYMVAEGHELLYNDVNNLIAARTKRGWVKQIPLDVTGIPGLRSKDLTTDETAAHPLALLLKYGRELVAAKWKDALSQWVPMAKKRRPELNVGFVFTALKKKLIKHRILRTDKSGILNLRVKINGKLYPASKAAVSGYIVVTCYNELKNEVNRSFTASQRTDGTEPNSSIATVGETGPAGEITAVTSRYSYKTFIIPMDTLHQLVKFYLKKSGEVEKKFVKACSDIEVELAKSSSMAEASRVKFNDAIATLVACAVCSATTLRYDVYITFMAVQHRAPFKYYRSICAYIGLLEQKSCLDFEKRLLVALIEQVVIKACLCCEGVRFQALVTQLSSALSMRECPEIAVSMIEEKTQVTLVGIKVTGIIFSLLIVCEKLTMICATEVDRISLRNQRWLVQVST